jgi:threonine dehydratase
MTLASDRWGVLGSRWEIGYMGFDQIPANFRWNERRPMDKKDWETHTTTFSDIEVARGRLKNNALVTDCALQRDLSRVTGVQLYLKKEYQQYTGAFKERGARNVLEELLEYHGSQMGIPITVVMPLGAPMTKVNRCKAMGAKVIQHGETFGEAKKFAQTSDVFLGVPYIDPFNDPWVMAGAGTIGLEVLDQVPDLDAVVVPVGGAGLIAGLSLAIKTRKPDVLIIGAEPESASSLTAAMERGHPVHVDVSYTVADGLSVPMVGQKSYDLASQYVDDVVQVPEELIPLAILRLVEMERAVLEGAGATGVASLLPGGPLHGKLDGKKVVTILSGGNIDSSTLGRIIERGLAADRRLLRFQLYVSDRPGTLGEIAQVIGSTGANIKDLYHERTWERGPINMLTVVCSVELGGPEHELALKDALVRKKYEIAWPSGLPAE